MKNRHRTLASALIAVIGVIGALVAPALTCAAGSTCPMPAAANHCALPSASGDSGGATMTAGPPLCCTSEASGPSATLRDATAARSDWTTTLADSAAPAATAQIATSIPHLQAAPAASIQTRTRLSLHSTLLL